MPPDQFTRLRARPSVSLDEIFEGARGLIRMPHHHRLDIARNVQELRLAGKECRDHHLVGGVERAGHGARLPERLVRQPQTWEAVEVGLLEGERTTFG